MAAVPRRPAQGLGLLKQPGAYFQPAGVLADLGDDAIRPGFRPWDVSYTIARRLACSRTSDGVTP
jgi:hypothetical protein